MKIEDLVFVVLSKLQNSQNIAQKITASLLFFLKHSTRARLFPVQGQALKHCTFKVLPSKPLL